jgi:hypothetical protein
MRQECVYLHGVKIVKRFQPLAQIIDNLRKRSCWTYCYNCKKKWYQTETEYVHMLRVMLPNGQGVKVEETRFGCDKCLPELQSKLTALP